MAAEEASKKLETPLEILEASGWISPFEDVNSPFVTVVKGRGGKETLVYSGPYIPPPGSEDTALGAAMRAAETALMYQATGTNSPEAYWAYIAAEQVRASAGT